MHGKEPFGSLRIRHYGLLDALAFYASFCGTAQTPSAWHGTGTEHGLTRFTGIRTQEHELLTSPNTFPDQSLLHCTAEIHVSLEDIYMAETPVST